MSKSKVKFIARANVRLEEREYLAPGSIGLIKGMRVMAKEILPGSNEIACPCLRCVFVNLEICKNKLDVFRPACFGNDRENLSNKSLIYQRV